MRTFQKKIAILAIIYFQILLMPYGWSQVTTNGTSATTTSINGSGKIIVGIAGANASGISHNSYTEFSVPKIGVSLNNQGVNASTIVNEVTSSKRSLFYGPLEVLGSRAHVIVANPNGITLDGASFINVGGVVLSTGGVSYKNSTLTGLSNTVVGTGSGDILVTGQGVTGSMTTLQLLAARLKIDGPITNSHISPNANIAINAGNSELELDSNVSPFSTLQTWAARTDYSAKSSDILVDITPNGALSSSRININVNSNGAGVRFAGTGQASIGEFTITANGKVSIQGASIKAEKSIKLASNSIDVLNTAQTQSKLISVSQDVTLVANSGDINIFGQITGLTRNHFDANSQGGVTLNAAGSINLLSENADRLAIVFSSLDDLVIKTNGDLNNDTARLLSNSNTILHIKGDLNNLTSTTNSAPDIIITKTTRKYGNWLGWFGFKRHTTTHTINWGTARIPSQLSYIAGSTIAIDANNIDNSGEIDALSGALTLNASKITNRQFGTGSYFSFKNCGLTCWSKGTSDISFAGGQINANGSANLIAKQSISNRGSIVSYGNLTVTAPVVEALANYSPQIVNRPAGLYDFYSGARAIEITVPSGGTYLSPAGTLTINAMNPVTIDGGIVSGGVTTVITGGTNQLRTSSQYFSQSIHHIGVVGDIIP